jgi:hypothetical protein
MDNAGQLLVSLLRLAMVNRLQMLQHARFNLEQLINVISALFLCLRAVFTGDLMQWILQGVRFVVKVPAHLLA